MSRARSLALALALCAMLALAAGGTMRSGAAFTAATANPGNNFSAAASFCAGPGSQTVKTNRDTYVNQAAATSNFGTATSLFVRSQNGSNRRTLLAFSLPALPANCSVTAATLRVFATAAATGRTIQAFRASAAWNETTVTWNTQPGTTGAAATSASGTGWRTWDVLAQVQAMYSGTNNGFLLRDASENSGQSREQQYQAREGTPDSQDAELVVTWG